MSLIFKTNLNCSYVLLVDIVSIIIQFCKYEEAHSVNMLYQKDMTDFFNEAASSNRKFIFIFSPYFIYSALDSPLAHLVPKALTRKLT